MPERIGPYAIRSVLGRGAMAVVYEGYDAEAERTVAVKVLETDLEHDTDATARIDREIQALEKIRHRSVAQLVASGKTEEGRPYIVFEQVDGPTLLDLIKDGENPRGDRVIDWMIDTAAALGEAWKHHIVHRDIKPSNLMIDSDGRLKVVDFGLAKSLHDDVKVTQDKAFLGTPSYMSPEMGLGQSLDLRADMYSMGATFYHVLTGKIPFEAPTPVGMMMKHAHSPLVRIRSIDPSLPTDLCDVISRLMAKEPKDRYESYDDLVAELRGARLALSSREQSMRPEILEDGETTAADSAARVSTGEDPSRGFVLERGDMGQIFRVRGFLYVAIFLIGLAVVTAIVPRLDRGEPADSSSAARLQFGAKAGSAPAGPTPDPAQEERARFFANVELMQSAMSAVIRYEIAAGASLRSLSELEKWDPLGGSLLKDAWGNRLRYARLEGALISGGADGEEGTADDFALNKEMRFLAIPELANEAGADLTPGPASANQ